MLDLRKPSFYVFGDFRADAEKHILSRGNEQISLTPKVFETLLVFLEHRGEVLDKDRLMRLLWADSFVEESNLTQNVAVLRKALGENPKQHKYILTVPGRGYRFVADVNEVFAGRGDRGFAKANDGDESKVPDVSARRLGELNRTDPHVHSRNRLWFRRPTILIFTAMAAIALVASVAFNWRPALTTSDRKKISIAVLPITPIDTTNRDEIYEFGIADSLILQLNSMREFVVRPLSATRKYADIEQDPLVAGREQQVDYVLASNYQLAGRKFRITAQLFNVTSGQIEEETTYKREKDAGDVFAMQDAIAVEVANILSARFGSRSSSPRVKRGTTNEEAYRLYLQGMYLYDKRNAADGRKAVELLEQAARLDPGYAEAWAGMAHAHRSVANFGRSSNTHEEYQKSIEAINKALGLDENLADAHSALCENKMSYEWDFDGAVRECKRAIELDPNSSRSHEIYSRSLWRKGRIDESIAEINIAIDLEPASLFNQRNYGICLYFARRYGEAVTQLKRVIAMDPNFGSAYPWLLRSLEMQGNYPEAFEWFMKVNAIQKENGETIQLFKTAYQTSGWQGILLEEVKRFQESNLVFFHGAILHAKVGNKDQAFEYLEKSYQRRELWMGLLKVEPGLDSVRDDPRFDELIRRVGLN